MLYLYIYMYHTLIIFILKKLSVETCLHHLCIIQWNVTMLYLITGLCGGLQWIQDLLSPHLLHVLCRCSPVRLHVSVPGEKTVQVSPGENNLQVKEDLSMMTVEYWVEVQILLILKVDFRHINENNVWLVKFLYECSRPFLSLGMLTRWPVWG